MIGAGTLFERPVALKTGCVESSPWLSACWAKGSLQEMGETDSDPASEHMALFKIGTALFFAEETRWQAYDSFPSKRIVLQTFTALS